MFNIPDLRNKTVWGSGSNALGTNLVAGLPAITGTVTYTGGVVSTGTGAFYVTGNSRQNQNSGSAGSGLGFDASRSNSIYGNSNTVQPPAVVTNFVIKY